MIILKIIFINKLINNFYYNYYKMSERKKEMNDIKELSSFLSNLNKNILKINNQLNKTNIKINKTNINFKNNNNNNNNNKNDDEILFKNKNKHEIKKLKSRNNSINLNLNRDFSYVQNKKRNSKILDENIKEMSDLINRTQQDLLSKNIIGENINKGKINPVLRHKHFSIKFINSKKFKYK